MFDQILGNFGMSQHGQQAAAVLARQGWSPQQQQQILGAALPAAANAMRMQTQGSAQPALSLFNIFGGHPGRQFLLGAVAGLLRGDGVMGSMGDGAMGMVAGHMSEVLAQRLGMSPQLAGNVTAGLTPFIAHYTYEHLLHHPDVAQHHGQHPGIGMESFGGGSGPVGGILGGLMSMFGGGQSAPMRMPDWGAPGWGAPKPVDDASTWAKDKPKPGSFGSDGWDKPSAPYDDGGGWKPEQPPKFDGGYDDGSGKKGW